MTNPRLPYKYVCIKPDVTYSYYYECLKHDWDRVMREFIADSKCDSLIGRAIDLRRKIKPADVKRVVDMVQHAVNSGAAERAIRMLQTGDVAGLEGLADIEGINIENIIFEKVAGAIQRQPVQYELDLHFETSMKHLAKVLAEHCPCQLADIFKVIIKQYNKRYRKKFVGHTKEEVVQMLKADYERFKQRAVKLAEQKQMLQGSDSITAVTTKLLDTKNFSIEAELDKLIPNELGSMKQFFIKVILTYYQNLHPIIWAQIFLGLTQNVFVELPFTSSEIFQFVSKQTLLNSGPFVLKMLQMIRPFLTDELATKYNLQKLTYPVLPLSQVELIFRKVVKYHDLYEILGNFSASVGHVVKVVRVDQPEDIMIIKIIKPLAVAQSCWEFETLHKIFPADSCEHKFIKGMLESNGLEFDVRNEAKNIAEAFEYYTADYAGSFDIAINAKLTTIQVIDNVIKPGCWFALATTLAPGIPLSKLVEENLLEEETVYRAKLHRCLDLLVYRFFFTILKWGFYHGDLHAGNIFFSYEQSQMTLIDFGAVGHIDLYADDPSINALLTITIMGLFYNYEDMFDTLTVLLNSKCPETQVDMKSAAYQDLRSKLVKAHLENLRNKPKSEAASKQFDNKYFGPNRINREIQADAKLASTMHAPISHPTFPTIYSYLEYQPKAPETVIESRPMTGSGSDKPLDFNGAIELMIKYYATAGINIAIKFSELYEFQKAYALLLGVLVKTHYDSHRLNKTIKKAIFNKDIAHDALKHLETTHRVYEIWQQQNKKSKHYISQANLEFHTSGDAIRFKPRTSGDLTAETDLGTTDLATDVPLFDFIE